MSERGRNSHTRVTFTLDDRENGGAKGRSGGLGPEVRLEDKQNEESELRFLWHPRVNVSRQER